MPTLRTKKLPVMKIELQAEPPAIEVPDHLPKVPCMLLAAGTRNSGKTTATQSLLRKYKAANLAHRVFLISPTFGSNHFQFEGLVDRDDVFEKATQKSLDEVIERGRAETAEFQRWKENKLIWEDYKRQERRVLAGRQREIEPEVFSACAEAGLSMLDSYPPYKYGDCPHGPMLWLVLDDCQSSSLFNPSTKHDNNLNNLLIKHRHVLSVGGNRYPLNVCMLLQNFKLQTGGLSKAMRMNVTCMMLWFYRDPKLVESIQEEMSKAISPEAFMRAYDFCTGPEPYNHLTIEFTHPVRLRKNWDEVLLLEQFSQVSDKNTKEDDASNNDADADADGS